MKSEKLIQWWLKIQ